MYQPCRGPISCVGLTWNVDGDSLTGANAMRPKKKKKNFKQATHEFITCSGPSLISRQATAQGKVYRPRGGRLISWAELKISHAVPNCQFTRWWSTT